MGFSLRKVFKSKSEVKERRVETRKPESAAPPPLGALLGGSSKEEPSREVRNAQGTAQGRLADEITSSESSLLQAIHEVGGRVDERSGEIKEAVLDTASEQNSVIQSIFRLIDERTMDRAELNKRRKEAWKVISDSLSEVRNGLGNLADSFEHLKKEAGRVQFPTEHLENFVSEIRMEGKNTIERVERSLGDLREAQWVRIEEMLSELRQAEKERVEGLIKALREEGERRLTDVLRLAEIRVSEANAAAAQKLEEARRSAGERLADASRSAEQRVTEVQQAAELRVFDAIRTGDERVTAQKEIRREKLTDIERLYQEQINHLEAAFKGQLEVVNWEREVERREKEIERLDKETATREKELALREARQRERDALLARIAVLDGLEIKLRSAQAALKAKEGVLSPDREAAAEKGDRKVSFLKRVFAKEELRRQEAEREAVETRLRALEAECIESLRAKRDSIEEMRRLLAAELESAGAGPISCVGAPYLADRHEIVDEVPATESAPPGTVVEERRRGYLFKGEVLRPAQVVVAANP
ncbi:MAG: nucleotide exchange factor GrpE [Planctomycetes bacterium]|nr:nucleotide exchange factor GrpE [Planctomycetota bacterium]